MKHGRKSTSKSVAAKRDDPIAGRPPKWATFAEQFPEVVAAYDTLSEICRSAGPLDTSTVAVTKLAVSVGRGVPRTVHAHAKKALRAGVTPEALRQIALIALPTIGLPAALDALRWIDESIREAGPPRARSRRSPERGRLNGEG